MTLGFRTELLNLALASWQFFFFPPFSLSDIGRIKFSTQIQERTWDDFVEGHLITLLSWSLTSFLLVLNMLTPFFPFPPPPSKQTLHWPVWVTHTVCCDASGVSHKTAFSQTYADLCHQQISPTCQWELTFTYSQLQTAVTKPVNF